MKTSKEKKSVLESFYGKPKGVKIPKLNWSNFYRRFRFTLWFWLSLAAALAVGCQLLYTIPDLGWFGYTFLFMLFVGLYVGNCYNKYDRNDTCYGNSTLFFIWPCITWAIYCGCGLLFVKHDLVDQHWIGLIIGVVACVIFTLLIPLINYGLRLNVASPSSYRKEDDDLKPSDNDKKLIGKQILLVLAILSVYSALFFVFENNELKSKKQEILFEKQPVVDILSKDFVVRDKWYDKEVYAIVKTNKGPFAVEVKENPDVLSATRIKVLPKEINIDINGVTYLDFDKIEFETPASD